MQLIWNDNVKYPNLIKLKCSKKYFIIIINDILRYIRFANAYWKKNSLD